MGQAAKPPNQTSPDVKHRLLRNCCRRAMDCTIVCNLVVLSSQLIPNGMVLIGYHRCQRDTLLLGLNGNNLF